MATKKRKPAWAADAAWREHVALKLASNAANGKSPKNRAELARAVDASKTAITDLLSDVDARSHLIPAISKVLELAVRPKRILTDDEALWFYTPYTDEMQLADKARAEIDQRQRDQEVADFKVRGTPDDPFVKLISIMRRLSHDNQVRLVERAEALLEQQDPSEIREVKPYWKPEPKEPEA